MESGPKAVVLRDLWDRLPGGSRSEFLRRCAEAGRWAPETRPTRWEAMRPLVLSEAEYYRFTALAAGVLRCALLACRRRAGTAGELHRALDEQFDLPLLDPSQRLSAAALLRMARPDALLVGGTPWFVELNIGPNIYWIPRLEERGTAFALRWPGGTLAEPPSTLRARANALARTVPVSGTGRSRALVPTWRATSGLAAKLEDPRALRRYLEPAAEAARTAGLDVSVADLSEMRGGTGGGLWAGGDRIDVVFNQFAGRVVADRRSIGVLREQVLAGTVRLFVPEASCLLSAKQVLAWMHEDLELYDPADRELILRHVPWTTWLGPRQSPEQRREILEQAARDRVHLILKPSSGRGGAGFVAGHQVSERQWRELLTRESSRRTLVLQRRLVPDTTWMPFRSLDGVRTAARVPLVLSPFLVDRGPAGAHVRHPGPEADPCGASPVNAAAGAVSNTVLLLPDAEGAA
ncbi:hypothetical protein A6P39_039115 [Streptomyces sp. FXJ1.172]|uniref:hypothetical protein n=1 Tax=Streptomyces sp. FXJ1.172 TaxID=710705 RepID=UPI000ADDA2CF|nr:hypothetical protein [Streptomyces sp. FXJ1.172]WEO99579.1 hypothetical protein A6P39_039115 [Streptomyces sp. FXJ1.172]